jgi:hypothetical protein
VKKRTTRVAVLVVASFALVFAIDVAAGKRLAREEQKWREAGSLERESLQSYRRQFLVGPARDQNAAVWYRLAFERLRFRAADMHRDLLPLVSRVPRQGDVVEAAYRDRCAEAESTRVQAALACTHCDWTTPYDFRRSASSKEWFQAMVLGECLALNGSRHLVRRDWPGGARAFLTTLAVASDFSQGTLEMNVVAVTAAQWALRGFAEALSEIRDADQIDRLAAQFARLEAVMPSLNVGLRQHQLARSVQATSMARAYAYDRRYGFHVLLPWRVIAAWRLSQQERIISDVPLLTTTSDPAERSRLLSELSQPGPLSAPVVPITLNDALNQQDWLLRAVHAVQAVVKLQHFYLRNGEYPLAAPTTDSHDVEYERISEGKGYRLRTRSETGAPVLFVERTPDLRSQ